MMTMTSDDASLTAAAAATGLSRGVFLMLEAMILMRAHGGSIRTIAKVFGWSKSTLARLMPTLDGVVSQVGQEGAQKGNGVREALSRLGPGAVERALRPPKLPRESEAARLLSGLASLGRLINRDPAEIVAELDPEQREEAAWLAARVAAWLEIY